MATLYTDIDPFCCEVLRARVADGGLPPGEVWERDIKTITAAELTPFTHVHLFAGIGGSALGLKWAGWPPEWSIVTGGFPCQPVSVAGKGLAQEDARWLWPEMHRVIDIVRPDWVLPENVPGLRTRGVDIVLGDLERSGYRCWPFVVGADDVGAPHRRKRVWIVAVSDECGRRLAKSGRGQNRGVTPGRASEGLADKQGRGLGANGSTLRDAGHADKRRATVAHTNVERGRGGPAGFADATDVGLASEGRMGDTNGSDLRQQRERAGRDRTTTLFGRWPMPPGPDQHDWEQPRLIAHRVHAGRITWHIPGQPESRVGGTTDGLPRRLAGLARRNALKALGNSQVPQCVEVIARAMIVLGQDSQRRLDHHR